MYGWVAGLAGVRRRCSSEYGAHQVLELVGGRGSQKLLELWDLHAKGRGARVKAELYLFIMALVDLRRYAQNPGSHDLFGSIRTAGFKIVDKRIEVRSSMCVEGALDVLGRKEVAVLH